MANWHKLMRDQSKDFRYNINYLKKYRETKDPTALEWIVLNNANLVHKIVGNYRTFYQHKLDYDDLFSAGLEGLLRAVDKFDFSYENNFSTYATYWIKQSVVRSISDEGFTIKIPTHMFEVLHQVVKLSTDDDPLTSQEICEKLEITEEKYQLITEIRHQMGKIASLNRTINHEDETEIGDLINISEASYISTQTTAPISKTVEHEELKEKISKALFCLTAREAMVIQLRFGLSGSHPLTLHEIGQMEGVSRERIRQIESKALLKLKKYLKGYEQYMNI